MLWYVPSLRYLFKVYSAIEGIYAHRLVDLYEWNIRARISWKRQTYRPLQQMNRKVKEGDLPSKQDALYSMD